MTVNPQQFPWLAVIQKRAKEAPKGAVIVFDAQKKQVLIEWSLVQLVSAECLEIKKTLVDLGVAQTVPAELAFIKENPGAVETDGFLRACEPFFKQGVNAVDWNACAKALGAALRTIYTSDISAFGEEIAKKLEHDMVLFVTAKDVVNGVVGLGVGCAGFRWWWISILIIKALSDCCCPAFLKHFPQHCGYLHVSGQQTQS